MKEKEKHKTRQIEINNRDEERKSREREERREERDSHERNITTPLWAK